ncbi:MAG TPA: hypothetical protein VH601_13260 [Bryobacteraceae bacterium]|jgi:hypothetical protein
MLRSAITVCAAAIYLAASSSAASAALPNHRSQEALIIAIHNLAHVPPGTLLDAERIAADIFSRAGIETEWMVVPVSNSMDLLTDFSASPERGCTQPLSSHTVRAQILPHAPFGFSSQALGYSLPCAERGIQVTIYADRIEAVSQHTLACFYRVLGHALAHELGHVLLRSPAHEHLGIMKAVWSPGDWQRAAVTVLGFSSDQARRVQQELQRIENNKTVPPPLTAAGEAF